MPLEFVDIFIIVSLKNAKSAGEELGKELNSVAESNGQLTDKALKAIHTIAETNNVKYGSDWIVTSSEFKEKSKNTCIEKYGDELWRR